MRNHLYCLPTLSLLAALFAAPSTTLYAAETNINESTKKDSKSETPVDKKEKEAEKTELNGVFEAVRSQTVSPASEQITSWTIERIVPHGTRVREGQNIVWFETEDIDKRLSDAKVALSLSRIAFEKAEFDYEQFLETQKIERARTKRTLAQAEQDYDNFVRVDRDRQVLSAEFSLKSAQAYLENAEEELEQLTQMYEEDDLTEESEEIVLKRAKQAVESAQFRYDGAKIQTQRAIKQSIPRSEANQKTSLSLAQINYKKAMQAYDSDKKKRTIERQKQRDQFEKEKENLEKLQAERRASVLKAPIDGIVLYGELTRGQLGSKPSNLEAGAKVSQDQVVATIVDPDKLRVRVDLEQKHLHLVQKGKACQITATGFPNFKAVGKVKSVANIPYASGKFDCVITFKQSEDETDSEMPKIMPTMNCVLAFETEQ
ncbi:HlyD family secretion protein [Novipirellula aureliae]|uniref:HlyD family secretion protein n=1 Tax=Novipirellula aureliae TaxID=2527966 RepID=A0A5C6E226_9BACT|nr:HlyD family secretion protein [Novipirellula aureliae]TWU42972.1 HlyD family secretion protein [Novipirellula aureliae]